MKCRSALVGLLLLLCGCTASLRPAPAPSEHPTPEAAEPVGEPVPPPPVPSPLPPPSSPGPPVQPPPVDTVPHGAVDYKLGEALKLRVLPAEGTMPGVRRMVQLLTKETDTWQVVNAVNVPHLPGTTVHFWMEDLPGYPGAIAMEAQRNQGVRHGAVAIVDGRLVALDYHRLVAPRPEITTGAFLYLNKYMNQLWVYGDGRLLATFPTANGRDPWGQQPTWEDLKTNYKTPEGLFPLKQKIVNPPYNNLGGNHPPAAGGAPNNPLGTRWLGFEVLPGDGGGVWGFHGTYVPEQIGTWASEGCVRLTTPDAERLYDLVPLGAQVRIVSGRP